MLMVIPAIACVVICIYIYIYWEHMLMDPKKMHVFWSVKFLEKKRTCSPPNQISVFTPPTLFFLYVFSSS